MAEDEAKLEEVGVGGVDLPLSSDFGSFFAPPNVCVEEDR